MGAAPVTAAVPELQKKGYKVPGVIVLDVVEGESTHLGRCTKGAGTAIEALPLMKGILAQRPTSFKSISDAISWQCVAFSTQLGFTLI